MRYPDKKDVLKLQGLGLGAGEDPSPTISTAFVPGVARLCLPATHRPQCARPHGEVVNALTVSGETGKGNTVPCVAVADTLGVGSNQASGFEREVVAPGKLVKRLTPEEYEALESFPRGYIRIPWKKKPAEECPDGPRYRALGNSMAVNVMRWIGERIKAMVAQGHDGADT